MSDDTCRTRRSCRCSRWPDYLNRFGWPVTGAAYYSKVLGYGPITYWPLWETAGTTAHCLVNPLQDGTYSSPVGGWPPGTGIGDGYTAPFFDGVNDYVDVFSATFQNAINGATGSAMIWARVANVGAWTDGVNRMALSIQDTDDFNEAVEFKKSNANNTLNWRYEAGGVVEPYNRAPTTETGWMCMIQTWNKPAEEWRAFYNGAQELLRGALGVWAGLIDEAVIGSFSIVPVLLFHGWLAHCAIWDRALDPVTEVPALAEVP